MTKLIAGNWKMFKGPAETLAFFDAFEAPDGVDVVHLPAVRLARGRGRRGVADLRAERPLGRRGRVHRRVSAQMLVELGVARRARRPLRAAPVLRRDRRDRAAAREAALDAGLGVIACVGETEAEREAGETEAVLRRQVAAIPHARAARDRLRARLGDRHRQDRDAGAGAGGARADQVAARHAASSTAARSSPRTRPSCSRQPDVDGALVGGASLDPDVVRSDLPGRRCPARNARHPRRLGHRPAGPGQRGRARRDARLRRALARATRTRRSRPRARRSACPPGRWGTRRSATSRSARAAILFQDLMRVNRAIADGSLFENDALVGAFARARERGGDVHLLGLVSYGGVHSHIDHLRALLELAGARGWRSAPGSTRSPTDATSLRQRRGDDLARLPARADRHGRRSLLRDGPRQPLGAHRAGAAARSCDGVGTQADDPVARRSRELRARASRTSSSSRSCSCGRPRLAPGRDTAIFFNFRPDRGRQLSARLLEAGVDLTTMTRYADDIDCPSPSPSRGRATRSPRCSARGGLRQLHAAETEKYAHVTYFFNGGEEQEWAGETRVLVPSPARRPELRPASRRCRRPSVADAVLRGDRRRLRLLRRQLREPGHGRTHGRDPGRRPAVEAADAASARSSRRRGARRRVPRHRRPRQRREDARARRRQPAHGAHDEPRAARPHAHGRRLETAASSPTSHRPPRPARPRVPGEMTGTSVSSWQTTRRTAASNR